VSFLYLFASLVAALFGNLIRTLKEDSFTKKEYTFLPQTTALFRSSLPPLKRARRRMWDRVAESIFETQVHL